MIDRDLIAMRVAKLLDEIGARTANLGIGLPTLVSNYIPAIADVRLQGENGILGYGPLAALGEEDSDIRGGGGQHVTLLPGAAMFDSAASFAMIRGGHLDAAVLGAYQVSEEGDLANWMRPDRGIGSIGGAMDLVVGARTVIVAMEHTTKSRHPKIVHRCRYPLTGRRCVRVIVTDMAVIDVTLDGLLLREVAPGVTPAEVQAATEPRLIVSGEVPEMQF